MDTLIKQTTFAHDEAEKCHAFEESVRQWTRAKENQICTQDIVNALTALSDKLTKESHPKKNTNGYKQAIFCINEISTLLRNALDSTKTALAGMQDAYFAFILKILQRQKRSILLMKIVVVCLEDRHLELKTYLQGLDGDRMKPMITAFCQKLEVEDDLSQELGNMLVNFVREFVCNALTKEQSKEHMKELLDFAFHLYLGCMYVDENIHRKSADCGKMIIGALDDPFTHLKDMELLRCYIRLCGNTVKQPGFPPTEAAAKNAKSIIGMLLEKLGKRCLIEETYNEIFDLFLDTTKCPSTDEKYVFGLLNEARSFFGRLEKKAIKKNPELFKSMAKRFISTIDQIDIKFLSENRFALNVVDDCLIHLYGNNREVARHWVELLVPLFKKPSENTMRACYSIVQENKAVKWKDHAEVANQVFTLIEAFQPPDKDVERDEKENQKLLDFLKQFHNAVKYFFEGLKLSKVTKNYSRRMMKLVIKFLRTEYEELLELAEDIAERIELNPKVDKDAMIEEMRNFYEILKNEEHLWNTSWPLLRASNDFIEQCIEPFKDSKVFTDEDLKLFVSICTTCLSYDSIDPETGQFPSAYYSIYLTVMGNLSKWLQTLNRMDLAEDLAPKIIKCLEEDDENVIMLSAVYLSVFGRCSSGCKVVGHYLGDLIQTYLEKENTQLLQTINEIYPSNPKALQGHFQSLIEIMEESGNPEINIYLSQLFQKVSKTQAELFKEEDVEMLMSKAREDSQTQTMLMEIFKELCKRRPELLVNQIDLLLDKSAWNSTTFIWIADMLCSLSLYQKDLAPRVLDHLLDHVKTGADKSLVLVSLNTLRLIGFKYPDLLKVKRSELDAIHMTDADITGLRQTVLDMIDGKTSEDMLQKLQEQQNDIQNLVGRVDETEENIAGFKEELGQQGMQMDNVKNEISEQEKRLGQVEQTVDETATKVEEIDQKTLSHAPFWARDVSKLLNPVADHDWRLLSNRLGYSNDDIRGWAQQADPCMAMLNEWYATHKTREATYGILTQLQEMNRMDAAIIVENAMKNAEAVIEDEEFDYSSPPPIFISYQWAHQAEVKLLKQHLEMAGYQCWLDIGQMGGGDKLFEKIDKGIRGAKIVICCVTAKYAKSPNCNREVNLAVNLNKPLIPVLLEKCTWPPPGSMGPIFSEYLFIRFYQRIGEELEDSRYWPKDKFLELLMQFNMFGMPPDENTVKPEYKNWWVPVIEEITIDKNKTKNGGLNEVEEAELDKKAAVSPDVFISYQWGKQKNIIKLYERLTLLGFTCWLDIKQMGGGDSLYDKIDKGIRGSKVVLSCVTQKYALSANCRREISLADALKKPLVPLLLEQMTWPPSGPMSMVMTQLLYINFAKDESSQMIWDGPQFQELLNKIQENVPAKSLQKSTLQGISSKSSLQEKTAPPVSNRTDASKGAQKVPFSQELKFASSKQQQQKQQPGPITPFKQTPEMIKPHSKIIPPLPTTAASRKAIYSKALTSTSTSPSSQLKTTTLSSPQGNPRKLPLGKLSSITKVSSLSKSSSRYGQTQQIKSEPFEMSVSSKQLIKPKQTLTEQSKALPPIQSSVTSQPQERLSVSQQPKTATPSQRPKKLSPIQQARIGAGQMSPGKKN